MFKLSKLTDYATVILGFMAKRFEWVYTARDIAENTKLALPTVSKILKQLAHHQLLVSVRGAKGGYRLASSPEKITLLEVIDAMEPPFGITECSEDHSQCSLQPHCNVRPHWQYINVVIRQALMDMRLVDLITTSVRMRAHSFSEQGSKKAEIIKFK